MQHGVEVETIGRETSWGLASNPQRSKDGLS